MDRAAGIRGHDGASAGIATSFSDLSKVTMRSKRKVRTIRELGGEFFAASMPIGGASEHWELVNSFIDVMMGVLARHEGAIIENDRDLPVTPLPHSYPHDPPREDPPR